MPRELTKLEEEEEDPEKARDDRPLVLLGDRGVTRGQLAEVGTLGRPEWGSADTHQDRGRDHCPPRRIEVGGVPQDVADEGHGDGPLVAQ